MPAAKKDVSVRARRNRASTAATLSEDGSARKAPALPDRPLRDDGAEDPWHPAVVDLWADVWASPMAAEYHPSDRHQLYVLMTIYHDFYAAVSSTGRREAATEIRLQRMAFGLTPYDRRRLEWTIEGAEDAKARGRQRRSTPPSAAGPAKPDPRAGLRAV
jgi:hypothetical protein